jgi:hypothetical protein
VAGGRGERHAQNRTDSPRPGQAKYFWRADWTTQVTLIGLDKIAFWLGSDLWPGWCPTGRATRTRPAMLFVQEVDADPIEHCRDEVRLPSCSNSQNSSYRLSWPPRPQRGRRRHRGRPALPAQSTRRHNRSRNPPSTSRIATVCAASRSCSVKVSQTIIAQRPTLCVTLPGPFHGASAKAQVRGACSAITSAAQTRPNLRKGRF